MSSLIAKQQRAQQESSTRVNELINQNNQLQQRVAILESQLETSRREVVKDKSVYQQKREEQDRLIAKLKQEVTNLK